MRFAVVFTLVISASGPISLGAQAPSLAQSVAHERSGSDAANAVSLRRFFTVGSVPANGESAMNPAIRCGMTLLRADPKTDSAIRLPPQREARFAMRTARPAICGDDATR